jgi:hypothetical protein
LKAAARLGPSIFAVAACVTQYAPPSASEPHAIVKLRRTYEARPGTTLSEQVNLDGERAFDDGVPSRVAASPRNDAILVRPTPATFEFVSTFSHQAYRMVQETYYEQEPYTAYESYSCGTYTSPRTCSRSVTRYRSKAKTRTVNKLSTVIDGACQRTFRFVPRENRVYLIQFTYQDSNVCALSCFEQVEGAKGGVAQKPCSSDSAE